MFTTWAPAWLKPTDAGMPNETMEQLEEQLRQTEHRVQEYERIPVEKRTEVVHALLLRYYQKQDRLQKLLGEFMTSWLFPHPACSSTCARGSCFQTGSFL
jgi:hypothetical protein